MVRFAAGGGAADAGQPVGQLTCLPRTLGGQVVTWLWNERDRPPPIGSSPYVDAWRSDATRDAATWASESEAAKRL